METKYCAAQEAKYNEKGFQEYKKYKKEQKCKALVLLERQNIMKNRQESFQQCLVLCMFVTHFSFPVNVYIFTLLRAADSATA